MKKKTSGHPLRMLTRRTVCKAPEFAARIYQAANTPLALGLALRLKHGDYSGIVSATVNPMDYTNADTFGRDYLCAELMSKYPCWDLGVDTEQVALAKFRESEDSCRRVNEGLYALLREPSVTVSAASVISTAARKIERVLRRNWRDEASSEFSWDEASNYFDWGPGATTQFGRRQGDAYYKFQANDLDASPNLRPLCEALRLWAPTWAPRINYVSGSKGTTVPKNAKTDRFIAIEPSLNMFFQKGVGGVIRRRLHRLNLLKDRPGDTAQDRNAELARLGSISGELATIDLSSASDTISLELVRCLMPDSWMAAIELCRSPRCVLPTGESFNLQKVSSMGNGFTFELETLIFWGLTKALAELTGDKEHRISVYGDDIICGRETALAVMQFFPLIGFTINRKKSFLDGPFRESCGKHYFNGSDVTPFYVRKPMDTILRMFWAANSVRKYSKLLWGLDPRWKPVYDFVVGSIPRFWRTIRGPSSAPSDACLHSDWDSVRPSYSKKYFGWQYRQVSLETRELGVDGTGRFRKSLWDLERQRLGEYGSDVIVPYRPRLIKAHSPQWPQTGPWLV